MDLKYWQQKRENVGKKMGQLEIDFLNQGLKFGREHVELEKEVAEIDTFIKEQEKNTNAKGKAI